MKIRIEQEDGTIEVLSLDGRWTIMEGRVLDRIQSDSGLEHFFTKDGYYDGWGSEVSPGPHTDSVLRAMEEKRAYQK